MSMIGKTLGNFEITNQLGKGGMGEVYQAKDQKLGRDVAIKVLPEEFARDTDRVARFQREAKLLASLNHPNIAAIHGLEESGGIQFLVLELVEGETLADQIKRGPIPVEESLKLALQIAEALEAAHEKGVIHRDLKPANIKVTPDGKVKVLDFGLAKAFAGEQADLNLSNSPTLSEAATQQGVILGTAAYMSPEQARGKTVDRRADIWAFGVVLYEMLTGKSLFGGDDVSQTLARVLERQPDFSALPPNIHPRIRLLLERCLEKEARNRYSGIGDARVDIQIALADPSGVLVQPVMGVEPRRKLRMMLPWIAAAVVVAAIIAGVAVWKLKPTEPRQVMRFDYELPEGQQLSGTRPLAVSPDGRQFVYSTSKGLYLRSIDKSTARLMAGTEGDAPRHPFFSPDGKWIGYISNTDRKLKKISVNGGAAVALCAVYSILGAIWSENNTITYGQISSGIMRVSANGGNPESLIKQRSGSLLLPDILPDGKSVLYTEFESMTQNTIIVQSLKSGEPKKLFSGNGARYLPTGHIVYKLQNNLFAVPFDLGRLEASGGSVPLVEGVDQAAISDSGTLVYTAAIPTATIPSPLGAGASGRTLVWVDRKGHEEPLPAKPNEYRNPNISPDGTKLALTVVTEGKVDIWIWDLARQNLTRVTFEDFTIAPVWTPDTKRIAYYSLIRKSGGVSAAGVYWKAADGTGQDERLGAQGGGLIPYCWSRDGKVLIGETVQTIRVSDIGTLSVGSDSAPKLLLQENYLEAQPKISPDGKRIAYTSDESGKKEIYVRPFPDVNKGRWQVSTNGGDSPLWSPNGDELFYRNDDAVMAVSVTTEPSFNTLGTPKVLFRGSFIGPGAFDGTPWDIHPNGKKFLMIKPPASTGAAPTAASPQPKINVVLNWFEELKQRVPVK